MRGSKQYANKNLNAVAARPNAPVTTLSKTTTTALRGNLMVLQGTIKVSKPVGAAAIPVPPVTTPSLKKEKSNGGSSMVWKEATGTSKGGTIVDNNAKLDINKTENPWTEIPGASDVSPATRDTATKNSNWTDDDRYNNSRLDSSRENAEYSGNYPLYKEQQQIRYGQNPYDSKRIKSNDQADSIRPRSYSHNGEELNTREYIDTNDSKWERNKQHIDNSPPRHEVIHVSRIQSREKPIDSAGNIPAVLKAVRLNNSTKSETLGKMEVITSAFSKANISESDNNSASASLANQDDHQDKVEQKISYAALFPKSVSDVNEDKPKTVEERNDDGAYGLHEGGREGDYGRRYEVGVEDDYGRRYESWREGDYGRRYEGGREGDYGRKYDDGANDERVGYGDYPRRYNEPHYNFNHSNIDAPEDEEVIDIDPETLASRNVSANKPRMLFDPSSNKLVDIESQKKNKGKKVIPKGKKDAKDATKVPVVEKEKVEPQEKVDEYMIELDQEELIARRLAREKNKSKRLPRTKGFLFAYNRDGELVEVE